MSPVRNLFHSTVTPGQNSILEQSHHSSCPGMLNVCVIQFKVAVWKGKVLGPVKWSKNFNLGAIRFVPLSHDSYEVCRLLKQVIPDFRRDSASHYTTLRTRAKGYNFYSRTKPSFRMLMKNMSKSNTTTATDKLISNRNDAFFACNQCDHKYQNANDLQYHLALHSF